MAHLDSFWEGTRDQNLRRPGRKTCKAKKKKKRPSSFRLFRDAKGGRGRGTSVWSQIISQPFLCSLFWCGRCRFPFFFCPHPPSSEVFSFFLDATRSSDQWRFCEGGYQRVCVCVCVYDGLDRGVVCAKALAPLVFAFLLDRLSPSST